MVEIFGTRPTPRFLPTDVSLTTKPYGKTYDYRHYLVPEKKDKEDPRYVLLCPPSSYNLSQEAAMLRRIRERLGEEG